MKRVLLIVVIASISNVLIAQDLISKKGEEYLPTEGDWGIGLNATSFLNYVGNIFNAEAEAPIASAMVNQTIYGKKFLSDNKAYRATIGVNITSFTNNSEVIGLESDGTTTGANVTNSEKHSSTMIILGIGKEYRRGTTRLQGFYGAEGFFALGTESTKYTYGNTIKASAMGGQGNSRSLEMNDGTTFGFTLRGFVGAEYFIVPKISISAEYGWGVGISTQGGGSTSVESYDFMEDSTNTETTTDVKDSSFGLANDMGVASGSLALILHF